MLLIVGIVIGLAIGAYLWQPWFKTKVHYFIKWLTESGKDGK